MKIPDINLLIYGINEDAPKHRRARRWLRNALSGDGAVGIPWVVILGFLRITTHKAIMPKPLTIDLAIDLVDDWFSRPMTFAISPTPHHWSIVRRLVRESGVGGNLTTDAHLAALALEHDATLYSCDTDFSRFSRIKWIDPLADNL
jgi:uncharacterized protein